MVQILEQYCSHSKECNNNVVTLCCTKNHCCGSSCVTSPKHSRDSNPPDLMCCLPLSQFLSDSTDTSWNSENKEKNCLSNFLQSDCKTLHTFKPLYNGHLGDRRKWPLLRGGRCREVLKEESMCGIFCPPWLKKVAVVERWLLAQVRLYYTFLSYNVSPSFSFEHRRSVKMQEMPLERN